MSSNYLSKSKEKKENAKKMKEGGRKRKKGEKDLSKKLEWREKEWKKRQESKE